jgi:GT2 family glycosyltransferase
MADVTPEDSSGDASIVAHLDGFEGTWIVGWAYSTAGAKPCVISVADENGRLIAEGNASRERPDLAALEIGRSNFAFRVHVPDLGTTPAVHVFADGTELHDSPLPVGQDHFDGHLYVQDGFATGWITERLAEFAPPRIDILDGAGELVATAMAEVDDGAAKPGFAPARFRIPLTRFLGESDVALTALANGVPFAKAVCTLRLVADLDVATPEHCAGRLFSPDAPWLSLAVEIRRDGELVATAACDRVRSDVRKAHAGSNAHGFDLALPSAGGAPGEPCEFSFRLAGSRRELFGGPLVVGSRAGVIALLRRAAQRLHAQGDALSLPERSFMQRAFSDQIASLRHGKEWHVAPKYAQAVPQSARRLTVIIPVYRGLGVTQDCIESVLKHRNPQTDFVILVNDASPDAGMAEMLAGFSAEPNLLVLTNEKNLGFVRSVNRALHAASEGDVVLLNSDAEVFEGAFDELYWVAHTSPEIGTVTPLSNNATIFSYPHASLRRDELSDIEWRNLAQLARQKNGDAIIDVPTAHGFCMLIKREVLQRLGTFDESFGRGYGEENDFCAKAADLGYRNVAAGSVFVYHRESMSFAGEKTDLLSKNLKVIANRYPEYIPTVMQFEREDRMRSARWVLDAARLSAANERGERFAAVITNALEGGTAEAIRDIADACRPDAGRQLSLRCRQDGILELTCEDPLIQATFLPAEYQPLFGMLDAARPALVTVHQILGYDAAFIKALAEWIPAYRSAFCVHDHFAVCPRVTMIDSTGHFCDAPPPDVCDRCVALGGRHEASRLETANTEEHYELIKLLLRRVTHVVAPSANAVRYLKKTYARLPVEVIPHPESARAFPAAACEGSNDEILLLGAIGPHKGSQKLLEIARLARLRQPELKFRIVGYTDIDKELLAVGNVAITGTYVQADLPRLLAESHGRLALFLHLWPETYSYTLSEAVSHGFIPLVPDIGAPAERVRESGFGLVFAFPIKAEEVLALIRDVASGRTAPFAPDASPLAYRRSPEDLARLRSVFSVALPNDEARVA